MTKGINQTFVYGVPVGGDNFTDRVKETRRLKMNFENGLNVILISPRRIGKTSLVKRVQEVVDTDIVKTVYIDIYDCKTEYDFYNKFATALLQQTSSRMDLILDNIKKFLVRLTPKINFSPDSNSEFSLSLGITPNDYAPEEILQLPELLASQIGKHIIVCIDEFQQIAEWSDSLTIQKKMRGVWQHQKNASYCLFGSRPHMMNKLFQSKSMPFYQFGEPNYLLPIPTEDWIPFIKGKFAKHKLEITDAQITKVCEIVANQSSYVQQLSWNVMINTDSVVTEDAIRVGVQDLLNQCTPLFMEQIANMTAYQLNMLKAIAKGLHSEFTSQKNLKEYDLGTKSNVAKIRSFLLEKDFVTETTEGLFISDPVMGLWLQRL